MSGMLGEIGTIEWSRRTNGILGRGERARFLAATTLKAVAILPATIAARAGRGGSGPDPSRVAPPDSAFAREIVGACGDLDPMVVEHGYRSYIFARALGALEGIEPDEEALFAATMLHDYAFGTMDELTDRCFTLAGAEVAADLLEASPLSPALRHDVLDAITLHLNPTVEREQGEIQHLTHDGVLLDVLGARAWQLDRAGVQKVAEHHPRHGFTVRGEPLLRRHGRRVHGCRAGLLFRAGFGPALKSSPWRSADRASAAGGGEAQL